MPIIVKVKRGCGGTDTIVDVILGAKMGEDFLNKLQALVDAAEAIYFEAREKDREGQMWGGFEDDCPYTNEEMRKFERTERAARITLDAVFAVCEAAGVPVTSTKKEEVTSKIKAEEEESNREFARQNRADLAASNSDIGDFWSDSEIEAGIPKKGYF